jgi:hypothetical protein
MGRKTALVWLNAPPALSCVIAPPVGSLERDSGVAWTADPIFAFVYRRTSISGTKKSTDNLPA